MSALRSRRGHHIFVQWFLMAAQWNRAGHYIFILWFLLPFFFLLSFFPRLISVVGDWRSTILPHMVWPQCEFRMHVWNLLHAARWKYRTQNDPKNRHLVTIAQLCQAITSPLRHVLTIGKIVLSSNRPISSTCPHNMVNVGPLTAEIGSVVGAPLQISTGSASWQPYCTAL